MKACIKTGMYVILILNFFLGYSQKTENPIYENWEGWRGLEHEGVSNSGSLPIKWSNVTNVKWKTRIPGSGYSSPIVFDNNIYLTTSYLTKTKNYYSLVFSYFNLMLTFAMIIYLVVFVNQRLYLRLNIKELIILIIFSIIILFIALFILFSENVFDYPRCDSRKWVGSSLLLMLSIFSTTFFFQKKSTVIKRILGFSIILLIVYFFAFMPEMAKNHLFRDGYFSGNPRLLYKLNLFYFVAAMSIIFNLIPFDKISSSTINEKSPILLKSIIFWIINLFIIAILIIIAKKIIASDNHLTYRFGKPKIEPVVGWGSFQIIAISWIILVVVLSFNSLKKISNEKVLRILICLILIIGISSFFNTNYITVKRNHCRAIVSVNAESGRINWISEGLYAPLGNLNQNSPATPTPMTNGKYIYGYFGTSGMFCCDLKGKIIWRKNDLPFKSYYGVGASPILYDNKIVVISDNPETPYLSAIDAISGTQIWKRELIKGLSHPTCGSSRTPLVRRNNGVDMIFIWRGKSLNVFNLSNGNEISKLILRESQGDLVSSLISDSLNIYLADPESCRAINISRLIASKNPILWETEIKGSNVPSPVLVNKLLFVTNDRGLLSCLQMTDGKIIWKEKLPGRVYFSSPLATKDYVYLTDNDGLTTIVKVSKSFDVISNNKLNCDIFASIVPYGDKLFIRSFNELLCISQ